jgi:hypothetical protein
VSFLRPLVRLLAASAIALTACGSHQPAASVDGVDISADTVRATVPAAKLLTALTRTQCPIPEPHEPGRGPCLRYTLDYLIEREVINAYARAHDLRVDAAEVRHAITALRQNFGPDQLDAILRQYGVSHSQFESLVRQQLLLSRVQQSIGDSAVTESDIRAAYERERPNFTLVHMAMIQLATREDAERIASQATPENFADLARKYSLEKTSGANGGDLGTIPAGNLPEELVQVAMATEPGQISEPVESVGRWYLIKPVSVDVQPYEEVRDQLKRELAAPAYQQWFLRQVGDGVVVNPQFGRLDRRSGQVIPLNSTATALPSPTPVHP